MKKSKCENKISSIKQNKGITLIALIITIVILLILAVVAIRALSDNGGIIKKAEDVREKHIVGQEKEEIKLAQSEWAIEKYTNKTKTFKGFMEEKFGSDNVEENGDGSLTIKMKSGNSYNVKENETDGPIKDGITLNTTNLSIAPGGTGEITATLTGVKENVTWTSNNSEAIIVPSEDTLTVTLTIADGVTSGTSIEIIATSGEYSALCIVTVENINYEEIGDLLLQLMNSSNEENVNEYNETIEQLAKKLNLEIDATYNNSMLLFDVMTMDYINGGQYFYIYSINAVYYLNINKMCYLNEIENEDIYCIFKNYKIIKDELDNLIVGKTKQFIEDKNSNNINGLKGYILENSSKIIDIEYDYLLGGNISINKIIVNNNGNEYIVLSGFVDDNSEYTRELEIVLDDNKEKYCVFINAIGS